MTIEEFLQQPTVKEYLSHDDLASVYYCDPPEGFTMWLINHGINPFDYFTDSIPDYCFRDTADHGEIPYVFLDGRSVGRYCFLNSHVKSVTGNPTDIGRGGFQNCVVDNMELYIAPHLYVGNEAFSYSTIKSGFIENEQSVIGNGQFLRCTLDGRLTFNSKILHLQFDSLRQMNIKELEIKSDSFSSSGIGSYRDCNIEVLVLPKFTCADLSVHEDLKILARYAKQVICQDGEYESDIKYV